MRSMEGWSAGGDRPKRSRETAEPERQLPCFYVPEPKLRPVDGLQLPERDVAKYESALRRAAEQVAHRSDVLASPYEQKAARLSRDALRHEKPLDALERALGGIEAQKAQLLERHADSFDDENAHLRARIKDIKASLHGIRAEIAQRKKGMAAVASALQSASDKARDWREISDSFRRPIDSARAHHGESAANSEGGETARPHPGRRN